MKKANNVSSQPNAALISVSDRTGVVDLARALVRNGTKIYATGGTCAHLREHGFPIGDGTLDKLCMQTVNRGPPVSAWWGRRPLYDPDEALRWAEERTRANRQGSSSVADVRS